MTTSVCEVKIGICRRCGREFAYAFSQFGRIRNYCDSCPHPTGEEQKVKGAQRLRKLRQTARGKLLFAGYQAKYCKTPKGKAAFAKKQIRRRGYLASPELFAARIERLHTLHEPCTECGSMYEVTHQIDHIVALCLGGGNEWSNLQPLCILCHRKKSVNDLHQFRLLSLGIKQ